MRVTVLVDNTAGADSIWTGHCTGEHALAILKEELGDKVHALRKGLVFKIQ